ncbi:hypothetical protein [Spirosoma flavum]|uniref:DUF4834 family protein n=1 Tax=Spirosoma flavum TaxID=2048557 RepID=A0ABW6AM30_9BACT
MNNTLIKSILAGLLLGAALFVMPFFLVRLVLFFLLIGALFRLFGGGRFRQGWRRGRGYGHMPAFADRIRQMSDDEYTVFKQRYQGRCNDDPSSKSTGNTTNQ